MEIITRSGSLQILPKNNCPNKNMGKSNLFYPFSDCGELFGRAGVKGTPAGCLSGSRWLAGHLSQIISKSWRSHISWVWWIVYGQSTYYMYIYRLYLLIYQSFYLFCFVFVCLFFCLLDGILWSKGIMLKLKYAPVQTLRGLWHVGLADFGVFVCTEHPHFWMEQRAKIWSICEIF